MEIILLENIRNVGKFGARVNVANGYGRNFLIPQGKAVPASKQNIAEFEGQRQELEKAAEQRLLAAQARAEKINAVHITLAVRSAEQGKLYGSIGTQDLAHAFKEKGIDVKRHEIRLPNGPLRELGTFSIDVQLHAEVLATAKISLVPEETQ